MIRDGSHKWLTQLYTQNLHTKHTQPGAAYRGSKVRSGADDTQLYDFSPHEICMECLPWPNQADLLWAWSLACFRVFQTSYFWMLCISICPGTRESRLNAFHLLTDHKHKSQACKDTQTLRRIKAAVNFAWWQSEDSVTSLCSKVICSSSSNWWEREFLKVDSKKIYIWINNSWHSPVLKF